MWTELAHSDTEDKLKFFSQSIHMIYPKFLSIYAQKSIFTALVHRQP